MEFPTIFSRPLGSNLTPRDRESFENIRREIDRCTDEILLQPDWGANLSCCDAINSATSQAVVDEAFVAIRRKFSSRAPNVTLVALHLAESIVKNCGDRAHRAANDESFMKDLAKVARKYTAKKGDSSAREVSELSLDIIQAWGEAFLPKSKIYPNFAKTYHELRKEGLPFRPQYDESRVPVFTPPPVIPDDLNFPQDAYFESPNTLMDAELAAALALSMAESQAAPQRRPHHSNHHSDHHSRQHEEVSSTRTPFHQNPTSSSRSARSVESQSLPPTPSFSTTEVVSGCQSTMVILKEIILAAKNNLEIRSNEIAEEVVAQLRIQQGALGTAIERELGGGTGLDLETMFKINDDAGLMIQLYAGLKSGETQLSEAKVLLESLFPTSSSQQPSESVKPPTSGNDDILDIFLSTPVPQQSNVNRSSPPPSKSLPNTSSTSKPILPLAPPPAAPSRVLPTSLQKPPQQPGQSLDLIGDSLRPASQSNPPPAIAVDIFGDPIKPASSAQSFPDADPFSSKVSIDAIMSQPSAPTLTPSMQQLPQFSSPQPVVAPPSVPYDPFSYSQPPQPVLAPQYPIAYPPAAYAPPQPAAYPPPQPAAYPPPQLAAYPPPQPAAYPPPQPAAYPSPQPAAYPPAQPAAYHDPFAPPLTQYPPLQPSTQPPITSQPSQSNNPFDMF